MCFCTFVQKCKCVNVFPCTKCGACCRKIGMVVVAAKLLAQTHPAFEEVADFPYPINRDGSCSKLDGNLCSVYDNRPTICNIDKMFAFFKLSKQEYYRQNIAGCHEAMKQEGIYEQYKITF